MIKSFTVYGKPFGKQRARTLKTGRSFTPIETVNYENLVKLSYNQQVENKELFSDALSVKIISYFPVPESYSKKKKELCLMHNIRPTTKPDLDNIAKIVCDALNNIAYKDDSQIVEIAISKYYSDSPRVYVIISDFEEPETE